jgi:peptide-methionine (S)-S-oxide reductase
MKALALAAALAAAALPAAAAPQAGGLRTAVFAGGCFWSAEHDAEHLPGVKSVVVGYAGGKRAGPTYQNHEGHLEAIRVTYDPKATTYARLVDGFFHNIDPTDSGGQICDRGPSYRTAVFVATPEERAAAEAVKADVAKKLGKPVATQVLPAGRFWMGEAYHQDYARKNPGHYAAYRAGCGRDRVIKAVWARADAGQTARR